MKRWGPYKDLSVISLAIALASFGSIATAANQSNVGNVLDRFATTPLETPFALLTAVDGVAPTLDGADHTGAWLLRGARFAC